MKKKISLSFTIPRSYLYFHPEIDEAPGGSERQAFLLGINLSQDERFDVNYCVADYGQKDEVERIDGIKLWRSLSFKENQISGMIKLFRMLKKMDADVYVFRAANFGVAFTAFYVKYFLRKKVLYMVANQDETVSIKASANVNGLFSAFLMRYAYKFIDIITVQSKDQGVSLKENLNISARSIIKNIYRINLDINNIDIEKKDKVLWVGRSISVKQPKIFLKLAQKYPSNDFIMICPKSTNESKLFYDIRKMAESISNLEFIDYVEPHKISEYYKRAMIYVTTSTSEGFANTMMEAMEAMCPILSLNINPDNIIEKYEMGLYTRSIDQFYKNFETLAKDPSLRAKMGANARKYLAEHHNEEKIIDEFKSLILNEFNS